MPSTIIMNPQMIEVIQIIMLILLTLIIILLSITYLFFPMNSKKIPFDAYLVLGAAPTKQGDLSRMMRSRIDTLAKHYKHTPKSVIISGGTPYSKVSEASMMATYAESLGIKKEHIHLEEQARNTYENFSYSLDILRKNQYHSIALITNQFHMRRACFFARKFNLPCKPIPSSLQPYFKLLYRMFLFIFEAFIRVKCLFYEVKLRETGK